MAKAYIFDLFGTLVSMHGWFDAVDKTFPGVTANEFYKFTDSSDFGSTVNTVDAICEHFGFDYEKKRRNDIAILFSDWSKSVELFDDALETLEALKAKGVSLCLISNMNNMVEDVIPRLGLDKYFDCIFLSHKLGIMKPHPDIYHAALKRLGAAPGETVMIGDTLEMDVIAPERLGIKGVLLDCDNRHEYKNKIASLSKLLISF